MLHVTMCVSMGLLLQVAMLDEVDPLLAFVLQLCDPAGQAAEVSGLTRLPLHCKPTLVGVSSYPWSGMHVGVNWGKSRYWCCGSPFTCEADKKASECLVHVW